MEHNGQQPSKGPVASPARGRVGARAINMLAGRGYEVVAVSGKPEADDYLRELGAPDPAAPGDRPRFEADGKDPWAGGIDNVGGELLTWLTRTVDLWGTIASIGLAGSADLHTTVMPFILRGVNLLGINSSATLREVRLVVWQRIGTDLRPTKLDRICTKVVDFRELPAQFDDYLKGRVTGRTVVKIG
jgi:putative YhdH/YhfP family quinone oxidoreductase